MITPSRSPDGGRITHRNARDISVGHIPNGGPGRGGRIAGYLAGRLTPFWVCAMSVDNMTPIGSYGPPRPRILPRGLPCHREPNGDLVGRDESLGGLGRRVKAHHHYPNSVSQGLPRSGAGWPESPGLSN